MSDYDYVWEKMRNAVTTLAEHDGPIRERLATAAEVIHTLELDEFPPDTRSRMAEIERLLSAVEDPEVGSLVASAQALTDDQARQVARWLVEVYFRVHALCDVDADEPLQPLRVRSDA